MVDFKEEFPILKSHVYLNAASIAPTSRTVRDAVAGFFEETFNDPLTAEAVEEIVEDVRTVVSRFIGARPVEISFAPNVSTALSIVACSMRRFARRVLTFVNEFPSIVRPWIANGYQVYYSPTLDPHNLAKIVREKKIDVVALSHVNYLTGERLDVSSLRDQLGDVTIVLDTYQSTGALKTHFKDLGVDIMVFGSAKWVAGPQGVAVLVVREDLINRLEPCVQGWRSLEDPFSFNASGGELAASGRRFEAGGLPLPVLKGFEAAVRLQLRLGVGWIEERVLKYSDMLSEGADRVGLLAITPPERGRRAGIITLNMSGCRLDVRGWLAERRIVVSFRRGFLRVSPHFYNSKEDLDRFLTEISSLLAYC